MPLTPAWTLTLTALPAAGGAMDADRIYIPLASEQIVALDRESGRTLWTADVESVWPPVSGAGMVFVAASDEIHGLDAATGERRWRFAIPRPAASAMVFGDNQLIVTMQPDQILAFAPDGKVIWNRPLAGAAGQMRTAVVPGRIYVTVSSGRVLALDSADGRMLWDRPVAGAVTSPAIARDRVIVGTTANEYIALDASSGNREWRWRLGGRPVGAAADGDLVVLTAMDNTVRVVNRGNGHQRWQHTLPTRPQHVPVMAHRLVAVPGVQPTLTGFAAKDGAAAGVHEGDPSSSLAGPPLVDVELRPYAVAAVTIQLDGRVTALRPASMLFAEAPPAPLLTLPGRAFSREPRPDATRPR